MNHKSDGEQVSALKIIRKKQRETVIFGRSEYIG